MAEAMIGNATLAERAAMALCAAKNGACHCAKAWGYPRDMRRDCAALLARVKEGMARVEAEGA